MPSSAGDGTLLSRCCFGMRWYNFSNLQGGLKFSNRSNPMNSHSRFPIAIVACLLCLVLLTVPAYGYADPNTVGLLSQVLTPLLITAGACATFLRKSIAVAFAGLWQRLRRR